MSFVGNMEIFLWKCGQNLYSDGYCVTVQLFHNCLRNLENMIRPASFSGSLCVITVAQSEQFNLSLERNCVLNVVSVFKKTRKKIMSLWSAVVILFTRMKKQWKINSTQIQLGCPPTKFVASTKHFFLL